MERLDAAPLLWVRRQLDIEGAATFEEIDDRIASCLRELQADPQLKATAAGCRLELCGRTALLGSLKQHIERALDNAGVTLIVAPAFFVHDVRITELRPTLDVKVIAGGVGPPAVLAGLIVSIESMNDLGQTLVREASVRLQSQSDRATWRLLDPLSPSDEDVRFCLLTSGLLAIDAMIRDSGSIDSTLQTQGEAP